VVILVKQKDDEKISFSTNTHDTEWLKKYLRDLADTL
jgi:hypothetical protein